MSVSVVMTCHNEEAFIEEAIRSVAAQTAYDEVDEIIVVNDGSSDGSQALLERLAREIGKIRILSADGIGVSASRNLALGGVASEFVAFLDGDDFWVPEKLAMQLPAFNRAERVGLVYSDLYDFTAPDASDALLLPVRPYHSSDADTLAGYFVHDAPIIPSTAIVRLETLHDVGLFDTDLRIGEDMEICLRIAERWTFEHVPGGLAYKRRHGKNLTSRLEKLVPVSEALTARFAERNPYLKAFAARRMARRYAAAGNDCIKLGERGKALGFLWKSFRSDPLFWRVYAYLAMAAVPGSVGPAIRKSYWAMQRMSRREAS